MIYEKVLTPLVSQDVPEEETPGVEKEEEGEVGGEGTEEKKDLGEGDTGEEGI